MKPISVEVSDCMSGASRTAGAIALQQAEERARREDPTLLINILDDKPKMPRLTMAEARGRVARAAVTMLSNAASAFVDPSLGPVDAATMKAAYEELVARIGKVAR